MHSYSSQIMEIPSGEAGTKRTLEVMRTAVRQGMKDPAILPIARLIVSDAPEKDQWAEAVRLFYFMKDGIRYVKDPYDLEGVLFPRTTLWIKSGDCDDKTVAFAALAMSIGMPARFCAVKLAGKDQFSHVYPELFIKDRWMPFELTLKRAVPGVPYAEPSEKMRMEVSPDSAEDVTPASVFGRFIREIIDGIGGF